MAQVVAVPRAEEAPWWVALRDGLAPVFPAGGLATLAALLAADDDPRLCHAATTLPRPDRQGALGCLRVPRNAAVVAAAVCPITAAAGGLGRTVGEALARFQQTCVLADQRLGAHFAAARARAAQGWCAPPGRGVYVADFVVWWDRNDALGCRRALRRAVAELQAEPGGEGC